MHAMLCSWFSQPAASRQQRSLGIGLHRCVLARLVQSAVLSGPVAVDNAYVDLARLPYISRMNFDAVMQYGGSAHKILPAVARQVDDKLHPWFTHMKGRQAV